MREYREKLDKLVESTFPKRRERREQKDNQRNALHQYCNALISEVNLNELAQRRNAFQTKEYDTLLNDLIGKMESWLRAYECAGGLMADRFITLWTDRDMCHIIEHVITKKFGEENVFVDAFGGERVILYYPHKLEGKITLFLDKKYAEIQYDSFSLDIPSPVRVNNWLDAKVWLTKNGFQEDPIDYSYSLLANPSQEELAYILEEIMEGIDATGLTQKAIIHELTARMNARKIPAKGTPDIEIEIKDGHVTTTLPKENKT